MLHLASSGPSGRLTLAIRTGEFVNVGELVLGNADEMITALSSLPVC